MKIENVKITDFAKRHFDPKFGGTKILDITPEVFESDINKFLEVYHNSDVINDFFTMVQNILPGYADFCKLVVLKNFTNARTGTLPITIENYQYLRTGFSSRTPDELPVMDRWLELPIPAPFAEYIIVILYSKEQLDKERKEGEDEFNGEWGVVAILAQMSDREEPMKPITMMRNALGIEEGGSGVPIDRKKYAQSVEFWSEHAIVK